MYSDNLGWCCEQVGAQVTSRKVVVKRCFCKGSYTFILGLEAGASLVSNTLLESSSAPVHHVGRTRYLSFSLWKYALVRAGNASQVARPKRVRSRWKKIGLACLYFASND